MTAGEEREESEWTRPNPQRQGDQGPKIRQFCEPLVGLGTQQDRYHDRVTNTKGTKTKSGPRKDMAKIGGMIEFFKEKLAKATFCG